MFWHVLGLSLIFRFCTGATSVNLSLTLYLKLHKVLHNSYVSIHAFLCEFWDILVPGSILISGYYQCRVLHVFSMSAWVYSGFSHVHLPPKNTPLDILDSFLVWMSVWVCVHASLQWTGISFSVHIHSCFTCCSWDELWIHCDPWPG